MRANPLHQVLITWPNMALFHGLQSFICRLEELATYAVITVIVDFLIFMSFYPAGLSLVIELMFNKVTREPPNALFKYSSIYKICPLKAGRPQWDNKQIIKSLPLEESLNSVVYR